jgi:hypothetical protein
MSDGLRIWDNNGNITLDTTDRLTKFVSTYSGSSTIYDSGGGAASATFGSVSPIAGWRSTPNTYYPPTYNINMIVYVPGMVTDGTWACLIDFIGISSTQLTRSGKYLSVTIYNGYMSLNWQAIPFYYVIAGPSSYWQFTNVTMNYIINVVRY